MPFNRLQVVKEAERTIAPHTWLSITGMPSTCVICTRRSAVARTRECGGGGLSVDELIFIELNPPALLVYDPQMRVTVVGIVGTPHPYRFLRLSAYRPLILLVVGGGVGGGSSSDDTAGGEITFECISYRSPK